MHNRDEIQRQRAQVVIRAATVCDVQEIAEFQTACWKEAYRDLVPRSYLHRVTADDRRARWRIRISTGARQVALGHVGDPLAGVVSWGTCDEADVPELELMSLYVAAEYHGTGVASALLAHALGHAPAHLWVFEKNPRARAFYAKSGFSPDGGRKVDPDTGIWEQRLIRN